MNNISAIDTNTNTADDAVRSKANNYTRLRWVRTREMSSGLIKDLIASHSYERMALLEKYKRYRADEDGVPIFEREIEYNKVNNQVNNDFFSEIVDTKVGYMVGKPVIYSVNAPDESPAKQLLTDFVTYNSLDDVDADTVQMMAICGMTYRLCYIDVEGNVAIQNNLPWEVIFISDELGKPTLAVRYVESTPGIYQVYIYDKSNVSVWEPQKIGQGNGMEDSSTYVMIDERAHMFSDIPVIKFINNAEELGDCDKVLALIDAYDRTFSDVDSEIEQFRLAYLALMGASFDSDDLEKIKQTGALSLPIGSDAKFLTKSLDDAIIEHHLDRGERNILRFARSVNFSDNDFATSSGIALKFKLQLLENKALKTERKLSKSIRQMFKVVTSAWATKTAINYLDIWWQYRRNIPVDVLSEAETTNKLKGYVSEETRLSLLSFVDDVEYEKAQMLEDALATVNLDEFNTDTSADMNVDGDTEGSTDDTIT